MISSTREGSAIFNYPQIKEKPYHKRTECNVFILRMTEYCNVKLAATSAAHPCELHLQDNKFQT